VETVVRALAVMFLVLSLGTARADPSERSDRDRVWNIAPFAAGGAFYLVLEFGLKEALARPECLWCASNRFDTRLRSAGKWDNVERADFLSNITGYLSAPTYAMGMLVVSSVGERDVRRWFDDVVPVMQAGIVTGVLNQAFKLLFVRRRPFAEFKGRSTQTRKGDVNTSFFSGHTGLAFAMASSSGAVASLREYRSAPAIWIGGGMLAVTTGYLRVAADAHYATDVIAGAVVGTAVGLAIPLLFHRDVLTDEDPVARTQKRGTVMLQLGSWAF
jgi:membrane-associated phospholipid phosphatase